MHASASASPHATKYISMRCDRTRSDQSECPPCDRHVRACFITKSRPCFVTLQYITWVLAWIAWSAVTYFASDAGASCVCLDAVPMTMLHQNAPIRCGHVRSDQSECPPATALLVLASAPSRATALSTLAISQPRENRYEGMPHHDYTPSRGDTLSLIGPFGTEPS